MRIQTPLEKLFSILKGLRLDIRGFPGNGKCLNNFFLILLFLGFWITDDFIGLAYLILSFDHDVAMLRGLSLLANNLVVEMRADLEVND